MYCLNDQQIDYILDDIRARGIEMESLQQNLLDHVCCIIEQNLEANGDFECFYKKTIETFYKDALWEIEEETLSLLTFKNYYTMKKIMILSGTLTAVTMLFGIVFKFMHWPGASFFIILGIFSASFVFMPLLFLLKAKEKKTAKDKLIIGIGALAAILMSLSILFKVMHWPFSFFMTNFSIIIMGLLFLPIYFFTGIRNPETKVNTITSSILIVLGCGLFLTLVRTPQATRIMDVKNTRDFVRNQQILKKEKSLLIGEYEKDSMSAKSETISEGIYATCEKLKAFILKQETGHEAIGDDFESENIVLKEGSYSTNPFLEHEDSKTEFNRLIKLVELYNVSTATSNHSAIPANGSFIQYFHDETQHVGSISNLTLLNQLTQMQMFVLQHERELLAKK